MGKLKRMFLSAVPGRKSHDLKRLDEWFEYTVEKIRNEYAGLVDDKGDFKRHTYGVDVDGTQFSKRDLKSIAKKIEELHDFCCEKDVTLEIGGFDLLPHHYGVVNGTASFPYHVTIGIDASQTYCGYTHPQAFKLSQAQHKWSKPRELPTPVPPPAEPVEEPPPVDVSTSREITVRPIKLQPKLKQS